MRVRQAAEDEINKGGGAGGGDDAAAQAAAKAAADAAAAEAAGKGGDKGPVWPEDWRQRIAGDDKEALKGLERYSDPAAIAKSLRAAQVRISEGFKPEPFPDKGTDEQKTEWRKANGIPEKHDAYIANVGEGIVIGEEDQEVFKSFAESALAQNMPQAHFDAAAKWYMEYASQRTAALEESDVIHKTELDDAFTNELGPGEYRANKNNLMSMLSTHLPKEAADALLNARLPDGRGVFNDKGIVKGLFDLARKINPVPTLVGTGNDPGKSVDDRLAQIKAQKDKMGYDAWMKNDALRKEERELIAAKQTLSAK
jgi:hypothetical protein